MTSYEPLSSGDPVAGDSVAVAALAKRYADTAAEIQSQADNLRKLAGQSTSGWRSDAGNVFHDKANDLADRIAKAKHRYEVAGSSLTSWSSAIGTAQDSAAAAARKAREAQDTMDANRALPLPPASAPPPTEQQKAEARARAAAYENGQSAYAAAERAFHAAVTDYENAARRTADALRHVATSDGLADSWWDRNFDTIATIMKIVAVAVIVLAVVALVIACPFSAGLLVALGATAEGLATAATVVEIASAVLMTASLIFDSAAAATGKQDWTAAILDVVGLATLGLGHLATSAIGGLAKLGGTAGKAAAASRAARATMSAEGLPKILYSLASRSSGIDGLLHVIPRVGTALDHAAEAATLARTTVDTVATAAKATNLPAALTFSGEIAKGLAQLDAVTKAVPTSFKVTGINLLAKTVFAADAAIQWPVVAGTGAYSMNANFGATDHSSDDVAHTSSQWTNPLLHAR